MAGRGRVAEEQTRQIVGDYAQYRFRKPLNDAELSEKAGVKPEIVASLLRQPACGRSRFEQGR